MAIVWRWEDSVSRTTWITKYVFVGYYGATIMWTVSELIRYPFYICKTLKLDEKNTIYQIVNWLRYTAFIILYPVGISGEMRCFYGIFQWLTENMQTEKINPYRIQFSFIDVTLRVYIVIVWIGSVGGGMQLYQHMMKQRRKALNIKPIQPNTKKSSQKKEK